MKCGCIIYAHNGDIDYGSQAVLAAGLVNKHLKVPVSLISDSDTIGDLNSKFNKLPFEQIIEIPRPQTNNIRTLADGVNAPVATKFINGSRSSAWDVTPYERTLVIDSDLLIQSDSLNEYWNVDYDFLICSGMLDLQSQSNTTITPLSPHSINMIWATTIMFTKNDETKLLFDLVDYVRDEYEYFASLYEFDKRQFRNDFAFSIACHIMSGHGVDNYQGLLPCPVWFKDTDQIVEVNDDGTVIVLLKSGSDSGRLVKTKGHDIHLMNKRDLLRNLEKLKKLL